MSVFRTIADVRRANREAGQHFFDRDTMRAFGSRVVPGLYGGRFFVTREREAGEPYVYHVREALPDGKIQTPAFSWHSTAEDARDACRKLAREVRK